jgi:hypothetical protein
VALAFLGLHLAELAGLLMAVAGLAQLAATVIGVGQRATGDGPARVRVPCSAAPQVW